MSTAIKAEHINPFIKATVQTFSSMMATEIKPGKIGLKSADPLRCDVSGIIGLSGGARGSVALSFPRITALKVMSAFVGEKILALDKETLDGIGELANIVAGAAKQDLDQYRITISLPTVILGDGHELVGPTNVPELVVPFDSPHGAFFLVVCFKSET
jgi:chemotaxis protein CheX